MKIEIKIPEILNDITLYQYQQIMAIDNDADPEFYTHRILNIIYDIRGIKKFKKRNLDMMMGVVTDLLNTKPKFENRFTLNDIEYGFIPNLDDISFGEFIDLEKYGEVKDYHKLMSILFRPIAKEQSGNRYTITTYNGSNEALKYMPLGVALGAIGFFLTIGEQLLNATLKSLTPMEVQIAEKLGLQKNGDGIVQLPHLQGIS